MKIALILCFSFCFVACASTSTSDKPDSIAEQVAAHNQTAKAGDKIICKNVKEVGSFIKKRSCRTVTQIKEDEEARQRAMGNMMGGESNGGRGEN